MELSSYQAVLRLRRVQLLCKRNGLDGVLLVPGVDGRFSVCNQAMGYVLQGRSNRDTIDVVKLEGPLDDAVALVTPSEVRLYAPDSDLREQLQELLVPHGASLRILAPTSEEAADPDLLEENKLASFVHMLRGCKRLGIPCGLAPRPPPPGPAAPGPVSSNGGAPLDAPLQLGPEQLLALEKWPLLQAYGLEGVGRSGFFTMNFQVFDAQPSLQRLYGELDGRSLAVLLAEGAPTLRQHWDEMLQALGGKPAGQRSGLSEKQVVEPLAGYFAYGLLRAAPSVEQTVTMPPRVIFGPRSSDDSARSEALPLAKCGPGGTGGAGPGVPPVHLVVEAADPRSALRVARTYFLARGVVSRDVFADPDEEAEQGYSFEAATTDWEAAAEEVVFLMRLYTAMVEAARAAMAHFATVDGATALSAKAEALEVLARRAEQLGVGAGGAALCARLRFTLVQMDHTNRVTAPAVRGSRQLKVLRLSLPDVSCRSSPGKVLGGLVYADTFLEVPQPQGLPGPGPGPASSGPALGLGAGGWRLLVLTDGVAPLVAIPAGGCEEDLAARALRSLGRVVERLTGGQGSQRAATLATQRDLERRAAAAAAESQALAARLRARRLGADTPAGAEEVEDLEEDVAEADEAEGVAASAAAAAAAAAAPQPADALGRLLTLGGGDDAVLLTGAASCPSLSGTLYCFSGGLVFVEAASRATWVLDLRSGGGGGLEAVTMQQLPRAHHHHQQRLRGPGEGAARPDTERSGRGVEEAPGPGATSEAEAAGLGEAVVFRGTSPACGLAPACHLTTNTHVALPLEAMSPVARRFLIQSVLPAWHQTCREAAAAAAELRAASPVSYLKDMAAPNPFPPSLHRAHAYAVQSSSAGGAVKTWSAVLSEDSAVRAAIDALDAAELQGALSGLDPQVEALLLQPPSPAPAANGAGHGGSTGALTLVVGLPGAEQAAVAAAVAAMLGEEAAPRVALLPPDEGPLAGGHFEAALAAAAATTRHLVLATSSYTGLAEQIRMLAAAAVGGAAGRWRLAAVVVCCSTDSSYEEPAREVLAAGMLAQLLPGFVDCVVLGGSDTSKVALLAQLVSSRLPEVPQVRSGRTQLLRARQELLPPQKERAARMAAPEAVAARRWAPLEGAGSHSYRAGSSGCTGGLLGPLRATRVRFTGELDVARLRDALAPLGVPQDPTHVPALPLLDAEASPAGGAAGSSLVCVSGCVRLSPGSRPSELVGTRQAALRTREWPLAEAAVVLGAPALPAAANGQSAAAPGGDLLFIGSGRAVEADSLRVLLARCGVTGPLSVGTIGPASAAAPSIPATAAQLTPQQRAEIRHAHLFDPLPDGYCFNGTMYFDAFGDASLDHPDMARFISDWISEQQAEAAKVKAEAAASGLIVEDVAGPTRV